MEIKDLEPKKSIKDLKCNVIQVGEVSEFGEGKKIQNIFCEDKSGSVKLTLFHSDTVLKINEGDEIIIINGYCNLYKDEKQLVFGNYGSVSINGKVWKKDNGIWKERKQKD